MNNKKETEETQSDEDSGVLIDELLKITDPESGEVQYEGRV